MNPLQINIIYPASRASQDTPNQSILELKNNGFSVQVRSPTSPSQWDFLSGSVEERLSDLLSALRDTDSNIIMAGRGGYGASDLLPLIPWQEFKQQAPKIIVGFSDICALQSAAYTLLGWPSIHGPMPDTPYWKNSSQDDVKILLNVLGQHDYHVSIPIARQLGTIESTRGPIFGGCLSVLTNLIGTPYIPSSLEGYILFFEDVGEHPGRILRYFNQWIQSGLLEGVSHLILGDFDCTTRGFSMDQLSEEIYSRTKIATSQSAVFGHCSPNFPIGLGYEGHITKDALKWKRRRFGSES